MWQLIIVCWTFMLLQLSTGEDSPQERLVKTLFSNYDTTLRPVKNTQTVTNVTLNPALNFIIGSYEALESIVFVYWLRMMWVDELIRWDPAEYDGIEQLLIPMTRIWYPDIGINNMIDKRSLVSDDQNCAVICYNGMVLAVLDDVVTAHCNYFIKQFPFDIQNCSVHINSWMHTGNSINLFPMSPADLTPYKKNAEWELISFDSRRVYFYAAVSSTAFVDAYYDIVIQRRPSYYLTTFVLPSFVITTLALIGIYAPFNDSGDREEKVTMGLTTLLAMAIILLSVTSQVPKSSEGMPLLGLYILLQICITAGASLMAVAMMCLHSKWTYGERIPKWILKVTFMQIRHGESGSNIIKQPFGLKPTLINCYESSTHEEIPSSLRLITYLLNRVTAVLDKIREEKENRRHWTVACRRLDLLLMFIFNLLHLILTCFILISGYANQKIPIA